MDTIKLLIFGIIGSIVTYLQPVHNAMLILCILFVANIMIGILTDIFINHNRFRFKKAMYSFFVAAAYASIVASTFVICEKMGDKEESLYIIKALTYVFWFFYAKNINKNLKYLFPNSPIIAFLDFFLSLKIIEKIPALQKFLDYEKNKNPNHENDR